MVLCTGTQTFDLMTLRPTTTGAKVYAAGSLDFGGSADGLKIFESMRLAIEGAHA